MRDGILVPPDWKIVVRGKFIVVANAVRKSCVEKVLVRKRGARNRLLIPKYVYDAIASFERSGGYADLKLDEYLNMLFGDK